MEAAFILIIVGAASFWAGRITATPKEKSGYAEIIEKKYKTPEGLMEGVKRK